MPDFVAVTPDVLFPHDLKHHALLFDKMAVLWMERFMSSPQRSVANDPRLTPVHELEWLYEQKFLCDPHEFVGKTPVESLEKLHKSIRGLPSLEKNWGVIEWRWCRQMAIQMRAIGSANAVAFSVCAARKLEQMVQGGTTSIAHVIVHNMPRPSESTPWEAIFEFKADPDIKGKFYRFKTWMNQLASQNVPVIEIEDQIQELLFEYRQSMKAHRIKEQPGPFETLVTLGAEVVESIATLKFSNAAQAIFSIKHRKAKLLEAELSAPGRAIAYIASAESHFGHDHNLP